MRQESRKTAAAAAVAILFSSTASAATTSEPATPSQAPSSWQALSMLSPAAAIGFAGTASQAAPDTDPSPPPVEGNAYTGVPIPVIGIWLATLVAAVYILTKKHHGRGQFPQPPNSPP